MTNAVRSAAGSRPSPHFLIVFPLSRQPVPDVVSLGSGGMESSLYPHLHDLEALQTANVERNHRPATSNGPEAPLREHHPIRKADHNQVETPLFPRGAAPANPACHNNVPAAMGGGAGSSAAGDRQPRC